jgi:hypothetical protein
MVRVESFAPLLRLREILRRELLLPDKTTTGITIAGGQEHDGGDLKIQQDKNQNSRKKANPYYKHY